MDNQELYQKFNVNRVDGRDRPGGDRAGAVYFVLDLEHDSFAAEAFAAYGEACRHALPLLADRIAECYDTGDYTQLREPLKE